MNWYKTSQKFTALYISKEDYPSYMNGLEINHKNKYTVANSWTKNVYNVSPIYLSTEKKANSIKVDVSGLSLYPDLGAILQTGAFLKEDLSFQWPEYKEPSSISYLLDKQGGISVNKIFKNSHDFIRLTKTAVCLVNIPKERILPN